MNKDPVFDMETNASGKSELFAVTPHSHKVIRHVIMLHTRNLLLNDRPLIKIRCSVVAGRPDQLHSALKGSAIGIRSYEGG